MTALAVRDVLDEIAANAAELDERPAFPRAAFTALPLEPLGNADASKELFEQRVQLTRAMVDLVTPVI